MQINLNNKVALVTGASRGIGSAILQQLAASGARVIGTATSQSGADSISKVLSESNSLGKGMVLDVSKAENIKDFFNSCKEEGLVFDILVNNAGITKDNLIMRMSNDEWQQVIDTNLSSVYHMSKAAMRPMMKSRWGRIINITSVVASSGNPGQVNYVASKAGVEGITRTLAKELASRGILVNSVAPGFIQTEMTDKLTDEQKQAILPSIPLQRLGQPTDIAQLVTFLCSDQASYITGQTLHVNGGMI